MQPRRQISLAVGMAALFALAMQGPVTAGTAATQADARLLHNSVRVDHATQVDYRVNGRKYRGHRKKYRGYRGYRGPKGYRKYPRYRGYRGGPRIGFGFYYGPRFVVPPPVYYAPRPPVYYAPRRYRNSCGYWQARCSANWSRYSDIRGCLRYHGCL